MIEPPTEVRIAVSSTTLVGSQGAVQLPGTSVPHSKPASAKNAARSPKSGGKAGNGNCTSAVALM